LQITNIFRNTKIISWPYILHLSHFMTFQPSLYVILIFHSHLWLDGLLRGTTRNSSTSVQPYLHAQPCPSSLQHCLGLHQPERCCCCSSPHRLGSRRQPHLARRAIRRGHHPTFLHHSYHHRTCRCRPCRQLLLQVRRQVRHRRNHQTHLGGFYRERLDWTMRSEGKRDVREILSLLNWSNSRSHSRMASHTARA
jgi:hypothetical protein